MQNILFKNSWVNYTDNFLQSQIILEHPKNMIFTAQLVHKYLKDSEQIYKEFPYAEKFDIDVLNSIDWKNTKFSFDIQGNLVIAPEPIKELINLNKRLNYKEAETFIFSPFKIPFIHISSFIAIILIIISIYIFQVFLQYDILRRFRYL